MANRAYNLHYLVYSQYYTSVLFVRIHHTECETTNSELLNHVININIYIIMIIVTTHDTNSLTHLSLRHNSQHNTQDERSSHNSNI